MSNSLIAAGYQGSLWVGYRGKLPGWIVDAPAFDAATGELQVRPSFSLRMVLLDTPLHFTYYKPTFLREVLEIHAPQADALAYIDPDIVMKCSWEAFRGWFTEDGLSLIEDVNSNFPARHPKRLLWNAFFAEHGVVPQRSVEHYYNGGFLGLSRRHFEFLTLWTRLCNVVVDYNQGAKQLKAGGADSLFHSTDQDAMNFALTVFDVPLNTAGREAMDFAPGGYYLSHAIGAVKPWHGRHVRQALMAQPPSQAVKSYFRFANGPIQAHSPSGLAWRRFCMRTAAAIGRFYRHQ